MIFGPDTKWPWWSKRFPNSWNMFGEPVHWEVPNLDFLASALGELPFKIIYFPPEETFYFWDYVFSAYRPCDRSKLVALARKLVNDSVQGAPRSVQEPARILFQGAVEWVERGRSILAVEGNFFSGEAGHRRWIEGRYLEPVEKPSVPLFVETRIERGEGRILTLPEAYHFYYAFCQENALPPLKKQLFRQRFAMEVKKRWSLGIRNDLKVDGKATQGWKELTLVEHSALSGLSEIPKLGPIQNSGSMA